MLHQLEFIACYPEMFHVVSSREQLRQFIQHCIRLNI